MTSTQTHIAINSIPPATAAATKLKPKGPDIIAIQRWRNLVRSWALPPCARAVAWALADRINSGTGRLDPGVSTLMRDTGRSDRHVKDGLRALEAAGLIEVQRRRSGRSGKVRNDTNSYRLAFSPRNVAVDPARFSNPPTPDQVGSVAVAYQQALSACRWTPDRELPLLLDQEAQQGVVLSLQECLPPGNWLFSLSCAEQGHVLDAIARHVVAPFRAIRRAKANSPDLAHPGVTGTPGVGFELPQGGVQCTRKLTKELTKELTEGTLERSPAPAVEADRREVVEVLRREDEEGEIPTGSREDVTGVSIEDQKKIAQEKVAGLPLVEREKIVGLWLARYPAGFDALPVPGPDDIAGICCFVRALTAQAATSMTASA